jgi:ABC-type iron transport system FetAB permease component
MSGNTEEAVLLVENSLVQQMSALSRSAETRLNLGSGCFRALQPFRLSRP